MSVACAMLATEDLIALCKNAPLVRMCWTATVMRLVVTAQDVVSATIPTALALASLASSVLDANTRLLYSKRSEYIPKTLLNMVCCLWYPEF
jgi:hypothetical protein